MSRNEIYLAVALNLVASLLFLIFLQPVIGWLRGRIVDLVLTFNRGFEIAYYRRVAKRQLSVAHLVVLGLTSLLLLVLAIFTFQAPQFQSTEMVALSIPAVFLTVVSFIVEASILQNADRAVTMFDHLHALVGPHMTETEQLVVRSQFAQVNNKLEYWVVIGSLVTVATKNSIHVPDYVLTTYRTAMKQKQPLAT
jgi:hypothetical protein